LGPHRFLISSPPIAEPEYWLRGTFFINKKINVIKN
jgi:hypothetical protein